MPFCSVESPLNLRCCCSVQMRDMAGFVTTRRRILEGRPTLRASWVAFALANFAVKEYDVAYDAISKYYETSMEQVEPYEESEFYLFQNLCLEKAGKYEEAIAHLEKERAKIVDVLSWRVKKGQLFLLTGRFAEARTHWEGLVREQPENYRYHNLLQAALLELSGDALQRALGMKRLELVSTKIALSAEQKTLLLDYYTTHAVAKSRAFERIRLFLLQGTPEFEAALEAVIRSYTTSGIPSLCQDIMALVVVPSTQATETTLLVHPSDAFDIARHPTVQLALQITARLLATFASADATATAAGGSALSASAELWLWFLQAHLQWKSGALTAAMDSIERAIAHTPTALDMYTFKAKLYKAQGNFRAAAECMDQCRSLDLQDRYLNNKATKYFLRNDDYDAGSATIAMFTKHDSEGDVQKTLYDLQCSWYELEVSDCFARQHKWALALKRLAGIRQHFLDQYDDIFDFHSYCFRKTTLRAYLDELSALDSSFGHKRYQRALQAAVKIYLHLVDAPEDVDGLGHLSAADRKKERAKIKKQREREAAERTRQREEKEREREAAAAGNKKDAADEKEDKKEDADPYGDAYVTNKDFLQEANTWCQALFQFHAPPVHGLPDHDGDLLAACSAETLALVAEVQIRRGKYLKALRALSTAIDRVQGDQTVHPDVFFVLLKLAWKMKNKKLGTAHALLPPIVKAEVARLLQRATQVTTDVAATATNLSDFVHAYVTLATTTSTSVATSFRVYVTAVRALSLVEKNAEAVQTAVATWLQPLTSAAAASSSSSSGAPQWRDVSYEHVAELVQVTCRVSFGGVAAVSHRCVSPLRLVVSRTAFAHALCGGALYGGGGHVRAVVVPAGQSLRGRGGPRDDRCGSGGSGRIGGRRDAARLCVTRRCGGVMRSCRAMATTD